MDTKKLLNKFLGTKPKKDCKSKNKTDKDTCDMCGKKTTQDKGQYVDKNGHTYFICDECSNY